MITYTNFTQVGHCNTNHPSQSNNPSFFKMGVAIWMKSIMSNVSVLILSVAIKSKCWFNSNLIKCSSNLIDGISSNCSIKSSAYPLH